MNKNLHNGLLSSFLIFYNRAFNVAEPIHLFTAFDEAAEEDGALAAYNGVTIEEYFKTWSEQPGHPLVHVEINHRTGEMLVTQVPATAKY